MKRIRSLRFGAAAVLLTTAAMLHVCPSGAQVPVPGYATVDLSRAYNASTGSIDMWFDESWNIVPKGFLEYFQGEDVSFMGIPFKVKPTGLNAAATPVLGPLAGVQFPAPFPDLTTPLSWINNKRVYVLGVGTWLAPEFNHAGQYACSPACGLHLQFSLVRMDSSEVETFPTDSVTGFQQWADVLNGEGAVQAFNWRLNPFTGETGLGFIHMYQIDIPSATQLQCVTMRDWATGDNMRYLWNPSPSPGSYTVLAMTVYNGDDTAPPETVATVSPAPAKDGWIAGAATVHLTATDRYSLHGKEPTSYASGVKWINYSITGPSGLTEGSAPSATVDLPIPSSGVNTITYYAVDHQGNQESAKSLVVKVDNSPPLITWMDLTWSKRTGYIASWVWGADSDVGSLVKEYQWSVGSSPLAADVYPWTSTKSSMVRNLGPFAQRKYYFSARALSRSGLWSDPYTTEVSF